MPSRHFHTILPAAPPSSLVFFFVLLFPSLVFHFTYRRLCVIPADQGI